MTSTELFSFDMAVVARYAVIGVIGLAVLVIGIKVYRAFRRRTLAQEQEAAMRVRAALERQIKPDIPRAQQGG